jgi:hypothetical protein
MPGPKSISGCKKPAVPRFFHENEEEAGFLFFPDLLNMPDVCMLLRHP